MGQGGSVDVQAFLDAHPFSPFQRRVFALCFAVVLLDGFDTAAIGYIAPSLMAEWGVARPALAPVLSAALFGLAFGALAAGPLADRFGRRGVLVGAVLVFGLACLASASAGGLDALVAWRFLTGLGLGAAMPTAVTLTGEYAPARRRALITNAMFCGFPLGAALGGFLAAWMIPLLGWRSVLVFGGAAPLLLVGLLVPLLPESVRHMVARRRPAEQVRALLGRISAEAGRAAAFTLAETAPASRGGAGLVLSGAYLAGSACLWTAYFMGLVIFYALINWMPILFRDAGLAPASAALIAALFPLGGAGAILAGLLMDRVNGTVVLGAAYALAALAVYAVGQAAGNVGALVAAVFAAGLLVNTAQASMPALAAAFYPTAARATGVAWMLGFGRFGAIAGTFLVAELARRNLSFAEIFAVVAVPGLAAAAALAVKHLVRPEGGRDEAPRAAPGG